VLFETQSFVSPEEPKWCGGRCIFGYVPERAFPVIYADDVARSARFYGGSAIPFWGRFQCGPPERAYFLDDRARRLPPRLSCPRVRRGCGVAGKNVLIEGRQDIDGSK
jgi:hypothetical protein